LVRGKGCIGWYFVAGAGENADAGKEAQIFFQDAHLMLIRDDTTAVF